MKTVLKMAGGALIPASNVLVYGGLPKSQHNGRLSEFCEQAATLVGQTVTDIMSPTHPVSSEYVLAAGCIVGLLGLRTGWALIRHGLMQS